MAHVTFIHGVGNKPELDKLQSIWLRNLVAGNLNLGAQGVTTSMIYWADVLYPEPDANVAAYERAWRPEEATTESIDAAGVDSFPKVGTAEEAAFIAGLAVKLGGTLAAPIDIETVPSDRGEKQAGFEAYERIPLPWPLKKAFMEAYIRDTHHYLFNVSYSPRPGTTFSVQKEIRERFVKALSQVKDHPHIVVSHSMGTVIAYDCLKRVSECPVIDGLMTIGSPLGLDEVQDKLQPGWMREDGFPTGKLEGRWVNVFDRLDPVAGFDPNLANDYRRGGNSVVEDVPESNTGLWRHSIVKYLRGPKLCQALHEMLEL
jgi:pimeloyl-ACP methyl ester carboxylesterase